MYLVEKEKKQMASLRQSQEAQLNAYSVQIEHLKQQIEQMQQNHNNNNSSSQSSQQSGSGDNAALQVMKNSANGFSQSPRSAFSTLSSSASATKVRFLQLFH